VIYIAKKRNKIKSDLESGERLVWHIKKPLIQTCINGFSIFGNQ